MDGSFPGGVKPLGLGAEAELPGTEGSDTLDETQVLRCGLLGSPAVVGRGGW